MIHKFQMKGYNLVLDVNSGAVHVFDDLSYVMLDYLNPPMAAECPAEVLSAFAGKYGEDNVRSVYSEILELYNMEQLFSADDYAQFADRMVAAPVKAMCLHIAHDCNLRCNYCFAAQGDFGGGRKLMPLETGKQAIDFLISNSQGRRNLELDFFGGEPLMNFDVVKEIVLYAREQEKIHNKNFRFTITTNGLLLSDDKIDFINREMSNVVLSIDGRKEINDKLRVRVDGSGSYDSILPKYQRLVEKRGDGQYYVRGTFTKYNLDFAEDVEHMYECGFDQISIEPCVSESDVPYALTEADLPAVYVDYERLADMVIKHKQAGDTFNFFHFKLDLDQGPCAIKRLRGCGCGNEYVAITPEGDIYPCHQFVGMEEWKMGNLSDGTFNLTMKERFAKANIYSKEE